ncbi:class I tRNA ligase family protein, partial [Streptococcus pneumoniae]
DDQQLCEANGIALVVPVDERGRFTSEIRDYVGQNVFEANPKIIKDLKARGLVLRHEQYRHNYPHCWRTDQPLIYRAMTSWYVE